MLPLYLIRDADAWCEAHYDEHVSLLKTIAAIPAPSCHEEERAKFVMSWLDRAGAHGAETDSALNVVLRMGGGDGGIRVFMAHTDVVFPDTDPLPVEERDGRIYAPGVGDDSANVAALMMCVKFIVERGIAPAVPVIFAFNSGEEGLGDLKGVRRIMDQYGDRVSELISFDGQIDEITTRAVGSERWRVTMSTCGGHSWSEFGEPSAIHRMAELICALYRQEIPSKDGARTTYNVGMIDGGTSVNTIAQDASMLYEYRSDDIECLKIMRERFFAAVDAANKSGVKCERELLGVRPCMSEVDAVREEALIARCADAIRSVIGREPQIRSGSTDANIPLSMGIPSVTFGLYKGRGAHTREEYVEKASLTPGLKIGMRTILGSIV